MASQKTTDETVGLVADRFQIASGQLGTKIHRWRTLFKQYDIGTSENTERKTDERQQSLNNDQSLQNLTASVLYNNVETVFARLSSLFDLEGWHSVVPRPGTKYESAINVETMLQNEIDEGGINEVLLRGLKQSCIIGNFTIKVMWHEEEGVIYQPSLDKKKWLKRDGTVFSSPIIKLVQYYDFYPDPRGTSIVECEYVCEDGTQDIDDMEMFAKMGYYDQSVVNKLRKSLKSETVWGDPVTIQNQNYSQRDPHRKAFRVITYQEDKRYIYGVVPFGQVPSKDALLILNPNNQDNPYDHRQKQYITFGINFDPSSPFAKGIVEALRDNQAVETAFLNMTVEALVKILRPMTLWDDDLGIDIKELSTYIPGKPLVADTVIGRLQDHYMELSPDPNVLNAMTHIMSLMRQQDEDIGANTQYVTGSAGYGSNKTARGTMQLTQNALSRDNTPKVSLALGATKLIEMMHDLNKQHGTPQDDIYGSYNMKVFEHAAADKMMRMNTLMQMLPYVTQVGGNHIEVAKRILRAGGVSALEGIFPNDGSMEKNQEEQGRVALMQMMMQGGGGAQSNR